jgi:CheY-like chemotaxis protein
MEAVKSQRVRDVLLVDDSENDRILLSEALRSAEPSLRIHHVSDGDECLAFLRAGAENGTHAVPDLVLLDLHLRRMEGTEVLGALRSDLLLCHVPVVVLSTSASAHEVAEVWRCGARCSCSCLTGRRWPSAPPRRCSAPLRAEPIGRVRSATR